MKKNKLDLEKIVEESKKIEDLTESMEIGKNSKGNKVLCFNNDYLKWYDYFPIVEYWKNLINSLEEKDFLFIRIGEDFDDFEIVGEYGYAFPRIEIDVDVDLIENEKEEL